MSQKVKNLQALNDADHAKMLFYEKHPFYRTDKEHRQHILFFKKRIAERLSQIKAIQNETVI